MADSKKLEEVQNAVDEVLIEKKPDPQNGFKAPTLRVETVVVYLDRAEVCRSFKAKVQAGQNELLVTDLSQSIDKDSIRVEGRGSATIAEVSVQTKHLGADLNDSKKEELQKELDRLRLRESIYKQKQHRLEKQRSVLDGFADNVTKGSIKPDGKDASLNDESLQSMVNFFDMYDKQASKLDDSLHVLKQEVNKTKTQIDAVTKNMREMNIHTIQETKELTIIVESAKEEEVELYVSYIVFDAKWSPRYDMRVFSNDGQLKILYYGMIQQSSGEDWDDAKLCLSTATPSVGGTVPQLETQKLSFRPKVIPQVKRAKRFGSFRGNSLGKARAMESPVYANALDTVDCAMGSSYDMLLSEEAESQSTVMEVPEAEVRESIATTLFEIARRSSIPSDNVAHKVSVAIIDLKPKFEYECIPRKANHAYLKAKVKNTSPYALLAGPTSIFLDNNFVSTSELKAVSPQEEFTCSLGVDPAVKIDYKPVQKFREQSGLLSKTMCTVHKQVTEMKNSRLDSIHILMKDQLPLSTEEKLKVVLLEPSLKQTNDASKPVRLNKQNNVEWDIELQPQETREVILKYSVEHPVSETIEVSYAASESSLI